jgi:cytochrome c biogenesis protein CcmG, thiol:disulfide interchange protein DsbE
MTDSASTPPRGRLWIALIPVIGFAALALLFWRGLSGDPSTIPSALIGKPVPEFALPAITGDTIPGFDSAALKQGGVSVVNVWASWCIPCREEQAVLTELAKRTDIKLYGINYKDEAENARRFLGSLGQPFAAIGADESGRVGVDWGVYGVPETYVVDGKGIIRFKWIGPLSSEAIAGPFAAEIDKAKIAAN